MPWAPDYATEDQAKSFLRIPDDLDDFEIRLAVGASSRALDTSMNRQFGNVATPEARTYPACFDRHVHSAYVAQIDDLQNVAGLVVEVDGTPTTAYTLHPVNSPQIGRPYTELVLTSLSPAEVVVTARWGWNEIPATVTEMCLLQTGRLFTRRNAPLGVAGSPDTGSELRLLARLDPDVAMLGTSFRRWWVAG